MAKKLKQENLDELTVLLQHLIEEVKTKIYSSGINDNDKTILLRHLEACYKILQRRSKLGDNHGNDS